ncbi:MAG: phenylalanine--tRNA ligase subunit alpha [Kiritimatiellae bacterium]|nr:phenylalanine--tRNA ligase subunit alpha [Kiritimatiellia bacterium]
MKPEDILALKNAAEQELKNAKNAEELEKTRVKYLGRRGLLPEIMKELKTLPPEYRPAAGRYSNEFKSACEALFSSRQSELAAEKGPDQKDAFDPTLPGQWRNVGSIHPITAIIMEAADIFSSLGFTIADGPDIETEYYNFDALNMPADHPSRDTQDTFWLAEKILLRTQTSPVQIRVMERQPPPVRIIAPGRCYRRDTTDATHSANFHQIEGLYVDRNVSLADLKSDLAYFARRMMGPNVKVRFRPHFFPFTEPSVEYDFSCHLCGGKGCRICKQSGWIEISGAGMVNPKVFQKVGYDPETTTGYAFGMGVERIAMIKFGIPDIRMLYENDIRFLSQLEL